MLLSMFVFVEYEKECTVIDSIEKDEYDWCILQWMDMIGAFYREDEYDWCILQILLKHVNIL